MLLIFKQKVNFWFQDPNIYWKVDEKEEPDHYFSISPFQNSYSYEYLNGVIQAVYKTIQQNSSQIILFQQSSAGGLYILLNSNSAFDSDTNTDDYELVTNGSWISSK